MESYGKTTKKDKLDLSLDTNLYYVEDFKFWQQGILIGSQEKIIKMFVSGLKLEVFREDIYYRTFETLVDVMADTRREWVNYRDLIESHFVKVTRKRVKDSWLASRI